MEECKLDLRSLVCLREALQAFRVACSPLCGRGRKRRNTIHDHQWLRCFTPLAFVSSFLVCSWRSDLRVPCKWQKAQTRRESINRLKITGRSTTVPLAFSPSSSLCTHFIHTLYNPRRVKNAFWYPSSLSSSSSSSSSSASSPPTHSREEDSLVLLLPLPCLLPYIHTQPALHYQPIHHLSSSSSSPSPSWSRRRRQPTSLSSISSSSSSPSSSSFR